LIKAAALYATAATHPTPAHRRLPYGKFSNETNETKRGAAAPFREIEFRGK
jgi:hypothetical protein